MELIIQIIEVDLFRVGRNVYLFVSLFNFLRFGSIYRDIKKNVCLSFQRLLHTDRYRHTVYGNLNYIYYGQKERD